MSAPGLATLERRFLQLISQPKPLAEAARLLETTYPGVGRLSSWLSASGEEQASARLGIYSHMYFARLSESLREDFPKVTQQLGSDCDLVIARYLTEYPSDHPSLRYHGRHFPEFLRRCVSGELELQSALDVYFPDLAALEWARIDVFDAANAAVLTATALTQVAPPAWGALRVSCVPACRLVNTRCGVAELWASLERVKQSANPEQNQAETMQPSARLDAASEWVLVWRRGFRVYHRVLDAPEAAALKYLRAACDMVTAEGSSNAAPTLAELCETCADFTSASGQPLLESDPQWLQGRLAQWLADEVLQLR